MSDMCCGRGGGEGEGDGLEVMLNHMCVLVRHYMASRVYRFVCVWLHVYEDVHVCARVCVNWAQVCVREREGVCVCV